MTERLWLGIDGKYQVQASYVCLFQDRKVKLKKPNGAMVAVPLNVLCPEDIAFIAAQSKLPTKDSTLEKPKIFSVHCESSNIPSFPLHSSGFTEHSLSTDFSSSEEPVAYQVTTAIHQNIRHMSADESIEMLPKRSLSSITDQFKRQTFLAEKSPVDIRNLANLPSRVLINIASFLDVRSRLELSRCTRRFHQIVFKPDVWHSISFCVSDRYLVNDIFIYQLVVFCQFRGALHKAIRRVDLNGTVITASTFLLLVKYLENIDTLSVQNCWNLFTFQLATSLTHLVAQASDQYPSKISRVTLGNVLHRGKIDMINENAHKNNMKSLDSKSFGQDAWFINTALNKLTKKNVIFDVALCESCHVGAASQSFHCASCGILPLKKCITCAPRCDRCGNRSCRLTTCIDPKLKVQIARCGRCEQILALCNNEKSDICLRGRQPCNNCHRLYHIRCRTAEGTYSSNQCSGCGVVACPHCELSGCSGGCHGQWCKQCTAKTHLGHCKCIIIKAKNDNGSKSIAKRNVCGKCQKSCRQCGIEHFCHRCLKVHSEKCS